VKKVNIYQTHFNIDITQKNNAMTIAGTPTGVKNVLLPLPHPPLNPLLNPTPVKITAMAGVRVYSLMQKENVQGARPLVIKKDIPDFFVASAREDTIALILMVIGWTHLTVYPQTNVSLLIMVLDGVIIVVAFAGYLIGGCQQILTLE
tara:strand:+ start:997 stop:1440 length:444 start_codon:yes stop_codon:yes gene_type:complete